jgi:hypothetical protein
VALMTRAVQASAIAPNETVAATKELKFGGRWFWLPPQNHRPLRQGRWHTPSEIKRPLSRNRKHSFGKEGPYLRVFPPRLLCHQVMTAERLLVYSSTAQRFKSQLSAKAAGTVATSPPE